MIGNSACLPHPPSGDNLEFGKHIRMEKPLHCQDENSTYFVPVTGIEPASPTASELRCFKSHRSHPLGHRGGYIISTIFGTYPQMS